MQFKIHQPQDLLIYPSSIRSSKNPKRKPEANSQQASARRFPSMGQCNCTNTNTQLSPKRLPYHGLISEKRPKTRPHIHKISNPYHSLSRQGKESCIQATPHAAYQLVAKQCSKSTRPRHKI
ncbi:unnamed protein product [Periconia digitata]|uniref:Uncharacterized protein n=1 Tax=Periconia digitata TaxID=1303443 RepID=A0A9W4U727_9PLEO|nr:unnamed protein product [Periconia digitata]